MGALIDQYNASKYYMSRVKEGS